jgi:hypothetical protein
LCAVVVLKPVLGRETRRVGLNLSIVGIALL